MPTLDRRIEALERVTKPASRMTVVRLVTVGEPDRPMTKISHHGSGKTWHILPGETEAEFIARVRSETTELRVIFLTS